MKRIVTLLLFLICTFQATANNPNEASVLFAWAEANYPEYFSPPNPETMEIEGFLVRYYSATNIYLGMSGGDVYVHGEEFGGLLLVGKYSAIVESDSNKFTNDLIQNKTFYSVNAALFEIGQFTFNTDTYSFADIDEIGGGDYFINANGDIELDVGSNVVLVKLISTSNPDFIEARAIGSGSSVWELDTSIGDATVASFNNDVNALKNYFLDNGLWQTTITSEGIVNKYNSNAIVDGIWWIDDNIFYFNYPSDTTNTLDAKAFKLDNNKLYYDTDAKFDHISRLYYDETKADEYYNQLIGQ